MATYTEGKRASDAYRKDSSKKGLNYDKNESGPAKKHSTAKLAKFDKQCYGMK